MKFKVYVYLLGYDFFLLDTVMNKVHLNQYWTSYRISYSFSYQVFPFLSFIYMYVYLFYILERLCLSSCFSSLVGFGRTFSHEKRHWILFIKFVSGSRNTYQVNACNVESQMVFSKHQSYLNK